MNLLTRALLAELHIAFDTDFQGALTVSKLNVPDAQAGPTVARLVQISIDLLAQYAASHYGIRIQGWIGGPQPLRPELRALIDAARAHAGEPSAMRLQVLRDALRQYDATAARPASPPGSPPP